MKIICIGNPALRSGEYLGIAPGGAFEALFSDSGYPVLWGKRAGFARVAIKADKPIIPMFTENIGEITLTLAGRISVGRGKLILLNLLNPAILHRKNPPLVVKILSCNI